MDAPRDRCESSCSTHPHTSTGSLGRFPGPATFLPHRWKHHILLKIYSRSICTTTVKVTEPIIGGYLGGYPRNRPSRNPASVHLPGSRENPVATFVGMFYFFSKGTQLTRNGLAFVSPWNIVDPVFAIDIRAFELIEKPRQKSGSSFSANGALSLNPGEPHWVLGSNSPVRPERPR